MKALLNSVLVCTAMLLSASSFACKDKLSFVGVLKTNSNVIEVYSSQDGPHYTVRDMQGTILAEKIDNDELAQQFPQLKTVVNEGQAKNLDASIGITSNDKPMDKILNVN